MALKNSILPTISAVPTSSTTHTDDKGVSHAILPDITKLTLLLIMQGSYAIKKIVCQKQKI
jgi:hypothetical protein